MVERRQRGTEHYSAHPVGEQFLAVLELAGRITLTVAEQYVVALGERNGLQLAGERTPEGVGDRRHDETDDFDPAGAQHSCRTVGPVAQLVDRPLDPGQGGRIAYGPYVR